MLQNSCTFFITKIGDCERHLILWTAAVAGADHSDRCRSFPWLRVSRSYPSIDPITDRGRSRYLLPRLRGKRAEGGCPEVSSGGFQQGGIRNKCAAPANAGLTALAIDLRSGRSWKNSRSLAEQLLIGRSGGERSMLHRARDIRKAAK